MKKAAIVLVVAMARNRVIGHEGTMPWRVPSDLKRFRTATWGKPMIMGRKTWNAIGKALPGRESVVVTSDPNFVAEGGHVVHSLEAAVERARQFAVQLSADEIAVIGGGEIYSQVMDLAERIYMTELDCTPEGDVLFPELDPGQWLEESRTAHPAAPGDDCGSCYLDYIRKTASDVT